MALREVDSGLTTAVQIERFLVRVHPHSRGPIALGAEIVARHALPRDERILDGAAAVHEHRVPQQHVALPGHEFRSWKPLALFRQVLGVLRLQLGRVVIAGRPEVEGRQAVAPGPQGQRTGVRADILERNP